MPLPCRSWRSLRSFAETQVRENAAMNSSQIRRRSASSGLIVLIGVAFMLASAVTARAQAVSDPRIAEFDPSPDHWQVLESGQPAVVRYELGVYVIGTSAPFATADVGKPSPEADGKIRYDFSAQLAAWQLPGGDYEARVSAVGPEGAALSDPSNPFSFTTDDSPCTFSLNASKVSAPASGGTYGVDVVTGIGCEWAVTSAPALGGTVDGRRIGQRKPRVRSRAESLDDGPQRRHRDRRSAADRVAGCRRGRLQLRRHAHRVQLLSREWQRQGQRDDVRRPLRVDALPPARAGSSLPSRAAAAGPPLVRRQAEQRDHEQAGDADRRPLGGDRVPERQVPPDEVRPQTVDKSQPPP